MKSIALVVVLAALLAAQQREAYPGQSEHRAPPQGWTCTNHPNVPKSSPHHCECKRTCTRGTDENGNPMVTELEDPKCKTYCHKKHCTCPTGCLET